MRIALFDLRTGGHHIQHVSYLTQYFLENGDNVLFITWHQNKHIDRLPRNNDQFEIKYVSPVDENDLSNNVFKEQIQLTQGIKSGFELAAQWRANIFHLLCLDRSELPLFINIRKFPNQIGVFATLINPYYLGRNKFIFNPTELFHKANEILLKQLVKLKRVKTLFVLSESTMTELRNKWLKIPKETIQAIPDPIESFANLCSQQKAREKLDLPNEETIFLYFGEMRKGKGPDILLNTIPLVKEQCWWVIAGKPDYVTPKDINRCRNNLRNPERLIAKLDFIPDEEVQYHYLSADAVILPYRRAYKGTSGILQHAAAAGRPVIASDVGEVGHIVRENKLGILVKPESPEELAEGIRRFLSQPEEIKQQVKDAAINYAQEHHWRKMAKKARGAYLAALK